MVKANVPDRPSTSDGSRRWNAGPVDLHRDRDAQLEQTKIKKKIGHLNIGNSLNTLDLRSFMIFLFPPAIEVFWIVLKKRCSYFMLFSSCNSCWFSCCCSRFRRTEFGGPRKRTPSRWRWWGSAGYKIPRFAREVDTKDCWFFEGDDSYGYMSYVAQCKSWTKPDGIMIEDACLCG